MKMKVDKNACIGCGACVGTCDKVFGFDGNYAEVIVDEIPKDLENDAMDALEGCPVEAISLVTSEEDSRD